MAERLRDRRRLHPRRPDRQLACGRGGCRVGGHLRLSLGPRRHGRLPAPRRRRRAGRRRPRVGHRRSAGHPGRP
ncbi:MAG: phosphate ABC transporter substrate-binding protein, partial [Actinobacteria bacterium]